jgi:hypothetical protein
VAIAANWFLDAGPENQSPLHRTDELRGNSIAAPQQLAAWLPPYEASAFGNVRVAGLLRQMNLAWVARGGEELPRMNLRGSRASTGKVDGTEHRVYVIVYPVAQTWPDRTCYTQRFETDKQENGTGCIHPALSLHIIGNGGIAVSLRICRRSVSLLTGAERPIYI